MLALALDTATGDLSIALSRPDGEPAERLVSAGRKHLELLLPEIEALLSGEGLSLKDLDCLAVGTGPGTFSGLRVGIATARGLAQALKVPLYGGDSLEALALGMAEAGEEWLLPLIDARRGQVFTRLYRNEGDRVAPASAALCVDPDELPAAAGLPEGARALAAGNGVLAWYGELRQKPGLKLPGEGDPRHRIRAAFYLRLAHPGSFRLEELVRVKPLYIREPDADKTVLQRKREPWL